ncbi:Sim4 and Mal2 associated protein 2 [Schizosaccharomyces japonicus yFS275]|uniref:Sim4 and Mal2 associated protein 2 n=1 Tax=Schizosaccharomyces japonicus (strain yFS275 / FY16936) TaxID=402676 RepID=B6K5R4_SCHJY|nr:Sim4 and Mal2 associated protein 2 [Schizosaccharomyces japonicus yFS275]EEB08868.1 Sim4 and Mal2 associated protein 2 [Schizosaccharomyces japonicus yFS275]
MSQRRFSSISEEISDSENENTQSGPQRANETVKAHSSLSSQNTTSSTKDTTISLLQRRDNLKQIIADLENQIERKRKERRQESKNIEDFIQELLRIDTAPAQAQTKTLQVPETSFNGFSQIPSGEQTSLLDEHTTLADFHPGIIHPVNVSFHNIVFTKHNTEVVDEENTKHLLYGTSRDLTCMTFQVELNVHTASWSITNLHTTVPVFAQPELNEILTRSGKLSDLVCALRAISLFSLIHRQRCLTWINLLRKQMSQSHQVQARLQTFSISNLHYTVDIHWIIKFDEFGFAKSKFNVHSRRTNAIRKIEQKKELNVFHRLNMMLQKAMKLYGPERGIAIIIGSLF